MTNEQKDANVKDTNAQDTNAQAANATKLNAKFKETWSKLSDADIALYSTKRDQFVGKLKELYSLSKEDAEKKITALEAECGCSSMATIKAA